MKKRMFNRFTAVFIAAIMICGSISVTAFAEETISKPVAETAEETDLVPAEVSEESALQDENAVEEDIFSIEAEEA